MPRKRDECIIPGGVKPALARPITGYKTNVQVQLMVTPVKEENKRKISAWEMTPRVKRGVDVVASNVPLIYRDDLEWAGIIAPEFLVLVSVPTYR